MTKFIAGHYAVLEKVGQGGMGEVFKARDTRLNRFVAIKGLPPDRAADPEGRARLIREARAVSALNHPNIVTVHDIVTEDGRDFIVMEYVAGETLAARIARHQLRLTLALQYAERVASVLACAHAAGIVHRDLKPSNVMITWDGVVKVLDFGLAKPTAAKPEDPDATVSAGKTLDGVVMGTPAYMSPEQLRGFPADHRSDIFSFGLVFYEMLAARHAFPHGSAPAVLHSILSEEPAALPDSVPPGVRQIVAGCLEKDPAARFESARDLVFALRALAVGSPTGVPAIGIEAPPRPAWARKLLWTLAVLSLAAGLFAARYVGRPEPLDLSTYRFTPLAAGAEEETGGSWSRDGSSITYLKVIQGVPQVMLRNLNAPSPVQLTSFPSGVYIWASPFFSFDAELVYFIAADCLWSVAAVGGEPRKVLAGPLQAAALSPDGKTLAIWRPYEEDGKQYFSVWISAPPGAPPRKYEPAPFRIEVGVYPNFLRFSPDGSKLGLATYHANGAWFWVLPWPDGPYAKPHQPFRPGSFLFVPSFDWMPDSRHVCLSRDQGLWMGDTRTGRLRCLTAAATGFVSEPSLSPSGDRILFTSAAYDTDLLELPVDGSPPKPLLTTARSESSPSWSAAGDSMAYLSDRSGESMIWLRNPGGGWERPVIRESDFADEAKQPPQSVPLSLQSLALSPDGTRVAYCRRGKQWVSQVSGGRASLAAAGDDVGTGAPSWSPDSSSITFLGLHGGRLHIAIARVGSGQPAVLIPDTADQCASAPVWSPDGGWIACGMPGKAILLVSPDGKMRRRLPSPAQASEENFVLVWSRDAETIYIASSPVGAASLDAINVRTGTCRRIAEYRERMSFWTFAAYSLSGSLSPDGRSIATTVFNSKSDLWILEGYPQPRRLWFGE